MDGMTLLAEARAAGLEVRADGDRLVVRGPRTRENLARSLLAHKPDVMAAIHAVAERVAVMQSQLPRSGAVPFLMFRTAALATDAPGRCLSCGDRLTPGQRYRCAPCGEAARLVLAGREHESAGR